MKISKLLSMLLGLSNWFSAGIVDGEGAGPSDGALTPSEAGSAFESFLDGGAGDEPETPEARAERLAADELDGGEPEPDPDPEGDPVDETGEPQKFKITVDGKQVELTEAELAEAYKSGLRDKDYRQKTMATAEEQKAARAEREAAQAERADLAGKLHHFTVIANKELAQMEAKLTDEFYDSDPLGYINLERSLKKGQAQLVEAQGHLSALQQQHQAEQKATAEATQLAQHQALLDKLPGWADAKVMMKETDEIRSYMTSQGYGDTEPLGDHRAILAMRKAMLYDKLMERAKAGAKTIAKVAPKVERSSVAQTKPDGRTTTMKRLQQTGSVRDAAAAFAALM